MDGGTSPSQPWPGLGQNNTDPGCYFQLTADTGLPKNPILIQHEIQTFLGGKIAGGAPEANGTMYMLHITNEKQKKKILELNTLNGKPCKVELHPTRNFTQGIITCKDAAEYTTDELEKALESQRVVKVTRLSKWEENKSKETNSYLLKFNGSLPSDVKIGFIRCLTRPYYPDPMLCKKCYKFGHTEKRCKSEKNKCGVCSEEHETKKNGTLCTKQSHCDRCKSNEHQLRHRSCPKYKEEKLILKTMVDNKQTFAEAKQYCQINNKTNKVNNTTYASIVTDKQSDKFDKFEKIVQQFSDTIAEQTKTFQKLVQRLEEKDQEIAREKKRADKLCKLNEEYSKIIMKLTGNMEYDADESDMNQLRRKNKNLEFINKRTKAANAGLEDKVARLEKTITELENAKTNKKTRKRSPNRNENPPTKKANTANVDDEINVCPTESNSEDDYDDEMNSD